MLKTRATPASVRTRVSAHCFSAVSLEWWIRMFPEAASSLLSEAVLDNFLTLSSRGNSTWGTKMIIKHWNICKIKLSIDIIWPSWGSEAFRDVSQTDNFGIHCSLWKKDKLKTQDRTSWRHLLCEEKNKTKKPTQLHVWKMRQKNPGHICKLNSGVTTFYFKTNWSQFYTTEISYMVADNIICLMKLCRI